MKDYPCCEAILIKHKCKFVNQENMRSISQKDKIMVGCFIAGILLIIGGAIAIIVVETTRLTYTGSAGLNGNVPPAPLPKGSKTCFPTSQTCP